MTTQNFKVLFVLGKNRPNKRNECPIYCRITYHGSRYQFSTGLAVESHHWIAKTQNIFKKHPKATQYNYQLEEIKSNILTNFLVCISKKEPFSALEIYNQYIGKDSNKSQSVVAYYKAYLSKLKKLVGLQIKENTYQKFVYVSNHLEAYVRLEFNRPDIPLEELKEQFLNGFIYYLVVEKKQAPITINKTVQRFRTAIKEAILEGYLEKDPFASHKTKKVRKEVIFLTVQELKRLEEHDFHQKRLEVIKDLFIFCCYTGLAYREMSDLEKGNIQVGFDGNNWISMVRPLE